MPVVGNMNATGRSALSTSSAAKRVTEIPEYAVNVSRVPQTFG